MSSPPISKPTALTKSETATAFNPPKIAYAIPIIPIDQTQILIVADSEIPKTLGKSNIVLNASEPEYKIVGSNTIPKATRNKIDSSAFVCWSNRYCINSGIVVIPDLMYFGKR